MWQSGGVEKIERPLMGVALVFCAIMLVIGWVSVGMAGWTSGFIVTAVLGTVAVGAGLWGWREDSAYWVGTGALGAGLLFPTVAGIVPMILGFIIFILLISLRLFLNA